MPEKNLLMKAELTEIEIPEPAPQDASAGADLSQETGAEVDPSLQAEALPAEPQAGAADLTASPAENAVQNTDDEAICDDIMRSVDARGLWNTGSRGVYGEGCTAKNLS